jgi:hypothetical protein
LTKLEAIRQRKCQFGTYYLSIRHYPYFRMKNKKSNKLKMEVLIMSKKKQNKKSGATQVENKVGYGDKKLEGPNRPAE